MCRIAVVFEMDGRPAVTAIVNRMTNTIAHLGAVGEVVWVDEACDLCHRCLAIIDLTARPRLGRRFLFGFSLRNFSLGAVLPLVEIGLEWNRQDRARYRQSQGIKLENEFFDYLPDHKIEAIIEIIQRLIAAVLLLQQGGIS